MNNKKNKTAPLPHIKQISHLLSVNVYIATYVKVLSIFKPRLLASARIGIFSPAIIIFKLLSILDTLFLLPKIIKIDL